MKKGSGKKRLLCVFLAVLLLSLCGTPALAAETGAQAPLTAQRLPAPTGIRSEVTGPSSIKISWNKVPYARGYRVYRNDKEFGDYELVCYTKNTSDIDTLVKRGKTYYYVVHAVGETLEGISSGPAHVSCVIP